MTLENLDKLVTIKQFKTEPPDQNEFTGMLNSARSRLQDARIEGLSEDGQFLWHMALPMPWLWQQCAGKGIVLTIAILYFNVYSIQLG